MMLNFENLRTPLPSLVCSDKFKTFCGRVNRLSHCDMGTGWSNNSSKERLKWTKELHDMFEKAVNWIGGPDSPRGYTKFFFEAMAVPGLTIFHVKSHLQQEVNLKGEVYQRCC